MKKPEKLAVGIVVSKHGLWGLKSWKPVSTELSMAEAEALSTALQHIAETYVLESRREQVMVQEFRKILKEPKK